MPESAGEHLAGLSMNRVNRAAVYGVMAAHRKAGVPMIKIDIPALTPYYFGQLVYFLKELALFPDTSRGSILLISRELRNIRQKCARY